MSLQSMTGFSRISADHDGIAIAWELKSVNGKGLDVRFRLPQGLEQLEQDCRRLVQARFTRGHVQAILTVSSVGRDVLPVLNEEYARQVATFLQNVAREYGLTPASADSLLAYRGVVTAPENLQDESFKQQRDAVIRGALEQGLDRLTDARVQEGNALGLLLLESVRTIGLLTESAVSDPSRLPEKIRARMADQVSLLMDADAGFDRERLHQEAALLAAKADIKEETDRLATHTEAARSLLEAGGPVGRRLDFLAQELNREANTLCAKSNAASLSRIGLELKTVVDQFREQIQNLE